MARIKFSNIERSALRGEQLHVRIIYWAIKWKMDFKTGIAGAIPGVNIIDDLYFHEELRVDPIPGRSKSKLRKHTREEIRSSLKRLEKKGLIKDYGNFVFECLLAERDRSDQKSNNQAATKAATRATTKKHILNPLKNINKNKEQQPEQQPTTWPSNNPPPESGNTPSDTTIIKHNSKPKESLSNSQKTRIATSALEILQYLNLKSGKKLRSQGQISFITARLKEGVTQEECRAIIDLKVSEWLGDDKMDKCLTADTLFNRTKCNKYLSELLSNPADSKEAAYQLRIERQKEKVAEDEKSFQKAVEEYNARLRQ